MKLHKPLLESGLLLLTVFAVAAILETSGALRAVAAILLVFVLPGRAFLAGWFPHRFDDAPSSILLTIILSLTFAVLGGLLLNLLPVGLQSQTWAFWLGGITVFNGSLALLRSVSYRPTPASSRGAGIALRPGQVLTILLASLVVVGAVMLARTTALDQPRPGFTQLWMIPGDTPGQAQLGVQNDEGTPVSYWLIVRQGTTPIQAYYDIQLDSAGTWNAILQLPANADPSQPIEAQLYRTDQPGGVYRTVNLWLSEGYPK